MIENKVEVKVEAANVEVDVIIEEAKEEESPATDEKEEGDGNEEQE